MSQSPTTNLGAMPAFMLTGVGKSIPDSSITSTDWTAAVDTDGMLSSNTIVCPRAGWLGIAGAIAMSASSYFQILLYKNGSLYKVLSITGGAVNSISPFGSVIPVAASDVLTIRVFQNSGGAIDLVSGPTDTWWSGAYVR